MLVASVGDVAISSLEPGRREADQLGVSDDDGGARPTAADQQRPLAERDAGARLGGEDRPAVLLGEEPHAS